MLSVCSKVPRSVSTDTRARYKPGVSNPYPPSPSRYRPWPRVWSTNRRPTDAQVVDRQVCNRGLDPLQSESLARHRRSGVAAGAHGWRCPAHPRAAGGSRDSRALRGAHGGVRADAPSRPADPGTPAWRSRRGDGRPGGRPDVLRESCVRGGVVTVVRCGPRHTTTRRSADLRTQSCRRPGSRCPSG